MFTSRVRWRGCRLRTRTRYPRSATKAYFKGARLFQSRVPYELCLLQLWNGREGFEMTDRAIVPATGDEPFGETPPVLDGFADFAQAWTEQEGGGLEAPISAPPDLPAGFAESFGAQKLQNAADINEFFTRKVGQPFIGWFNSTIAGRGSWGQKSISGPDVVSNFDAFWDAYCQSQAVSLMEFIVYMCVFINERNGDLVSQSELFGSKGHPGIAYLFDSFLNTTSGGRKFRKASYNIAPNKRAGELFNDS